MADKEGPHGLLALICLTCGNEKNFSENPPATVICEKCGGTVFRNYFTPTESDEATVSHLEQTARGVSLDSGSFDVSPDELRDLNSP